MQGQTPEKKQVITLPLVMVWFRFQTDDGFVILDVDWKGGRTFTSIRMIDDAVDEEGDIGHEFEHASRIWYLIDGQLKDVGFSNAFEKHIKILVVGNETGLVQVVSTANV